MTPILIVTGCPGTGKTEVSRRWVARETLGVHLEADAFLGFLASPIAPVLPASRTQNETVTRAVAQAAAAYASGGYAVLVDGVIGPWLLPPFARALEGRSLEVDYVVLRAGLDETLERARSRPDGDKFSIQGVRQMHAAFADLGDFEDHAIDTSGLDVPATLRRLRGRLDDGILRLELSSIARG